MIIEVLKTPDDSEYFWSKENTGKEELTTKNEDCYNLWKENKDKFIETTKK